MVREGGGVGPNSPENNSKERKFSKIEFPERKIIFYSLRPRASTDDFFGGCDSLNLSFNLIGHSTVAYMLTVI